jgi:hypothetical protein
MGSPDPTRQATSAAARYFDVMKVKMPNQTERDYASDVGRRNSHNLPRPNP